MAVVVSSSISQLIVLADKQRPWNGWHFHDLLLEEKKKGKQNKWRKKEDKHTLFHPTCLERLPALLSSFGAELRCLHPSKIKKKCKRLHHPNSH